MYLFFWNQYAVEALSDALRMEMKPWGISVAIVEPGRFHTEFQEKAYTELEIDGIGVIEDDIKNHYSTITRETNEKSAKLNRPPSGTTLWYYYNNCLLW